MEAFGLELDVPCYTALFLHHAEATHGRHQGPLLLAEFKHLFEVEIRQQLCSVSLQTTNAKHSSGMRDSSVSFGVQ